MHNNLKILFVLVLLTFGLLVVCFFKPIFSYIYYSTYDKSNLSINTSVLNGNIHTICAESSNRLFLSTCVKNSDGLLMKDAPVNLFIENGDGNLSSETGTTDSHGEFIFSYTPPNYYELNNNIVTISAQIKNSDQSSSICINLIPVPIVMIYGFQETTNIYQNLNDFLLQNNLDCSIMEYDSKGGVINGATVLETFLSQKKQEYMNSGILVNKFTLITHSMGGLLARYYTTSAQYLKNEDVNKIIFTTVPHKGSYLATLGQSLYEYQSLDDLSPDSSLFTDIFESAINKGLNSSIQVANITSQYDEVVTAESSDLSKWGIPNEMFNIGDNNYTVDNILNGSLLSAPNHKGILSNKKVFERILELLNTNMPYPNKI